jgi:imidazolonepropionase-like amidohydrolase
MNLGWLLWLLLGSQEAADQTPFVQALSRRDWPARHEQIAIVDVGLIDGTGEPPLRPHTTVIIERGIIVAIGAAESLAVSSGAVIVDGRDKFLIPGLWDMHVHLSFWGEPEIEGGAHWETVPDPEAYADVMPRFVAWGVTGVRDMGGHLEEIDQWRSAIKGGIVPGPRIFRAGYYVDGPKPNDKFRRFARDAQEANQVVTEMKGLGVDFLKVHSRLPREAYFALAEAASTAGLTFCGHVPHGISLDEASNVGQHTVEHIDALQFVFHGDQFGLADFSAARDWYQQEQGLEVLQTLADNGTWFTPTVVVYETGMARYGMDPVETMPVLLQLTRSLIEFEIPLLAGTDTARKTFGLEPGKGLHRELQLLCKAGLTPLQSLQAATRNAALALGCSTKFGTIQEGRAGDLLLLPANPLEEITATEAVELVIRDGRLFDLDWMNGYRGSK